jgi:RNA polymerase-binding transcription factor DksA
MATPVTVFEQSIQIRLLALRQSLLSSDRTSGSAERIDQELGEVDAALRRIARGQYGTCTRCGRALGTQRLLAEPVARVCRACASGAS